MSVQLLESQLAVALNDDAFWAQCKPGGSASSVPAPKPLCSPATEMTGGRRKTLPLLPRKRPFAPRQYYLADHCLRPCPAFTVHRCLVVHPDLRDLLMLLRVALLAWSSERAFQTHSDILPVGVIHCQPKVPSILSTDPVVMTPVPLQMTSAVVVVLAGNASL